LKDFEQAKTVLQQQRAKAQTDYLDPASQFVRQRAEARPIQTVSDRLDCLQLLPKLETGQ
jgi:hypothetical protein